MVKVTNVKGSRKRLLANKTNSDIPKTAKEKRMWIQARRIAVIQSGAKNEREVPWELVTAIYKDAKKSGTAPRRKDVRDAKFSSNTSHYRRPDMIRLPNLKKRS